MSATGPTDGRAGLGIDALELFVEVLSQAETGAAGSDSFYDRLCEAVCRLAGMRRAIIFRYDSTLWRVRAAGAHGMDVQQVAGAHVTVESAPVAAPALREDRVVELVGDMRGDVPEQYAVLFPEPVRLVCAPMTAAGRAIGVILTDRLLSSPPLDDSDRTLLWTLGKAAALASVARIFSVQFETARQLEQRIDLAREIHEGVIQRLFGVSMALDGEGELPAQARQRCASETQAALSELRAALQRPLGRDPRATQTTLVAEVERLASAHPCSTPPARAAGTVNRASAVYRCWRNAARPYTAHRNARSPADQYCTAIRPSARTRWRSPMPAGSPASRSRPPPIAPTPARSPIRARSCN